MGQATFAELEQDLKKRRTRRELFLEKMDRLVPCGRLERLIEPVYQKPARVATWSPVAPLPAPRSQRRIDIDGKALTDSGVLLRESAIFNCQNPAIFD